jgi:hypothetical protein
MPPGPLRLVSTDAPQTLIRTCYPPGDPVYSPKTMVGHRVLGRASLLTQLQTEVQYPQSLRVPLDAPERKNEGHTDIGMKDPQRTPRWVDMC